MPSLAHPGGNLTGFYVFEPSLGAKLLEMLKEIAPHVARVAILSNPDANPASWFASAVAAAPKLAVKVVAAPLRDSNEIEAAMARWGGEPNFGDGTVGRFRRNRAKPGVSSGHRSRLNDEDSVRGPHQGQQSTRAAPTGRTHDCKRPLRCTPNDLLPGGGHPTHEAA